MHPASRLGRTQLLVIAFLVGAVHVFAFAPFGLWPLSFISLVAYFYLSQGLTPQAAFYTGLAYGYGLYGVGVSWVYVSLSTYGGMPLWMGSIAVLGFAGILALFPALTSYLAARMFPEHFRLLALPLLWTVFEWMKSWVLTGFPWLDVGYVQTATWFFAWAPIGGIYLVSFMVVLASALAVILLSGKGKAYASFGLLSVIVASWCLNSISWTQPLGKPLQVAVVQANVAISSKWQSDQRDALIRQYRSLSEQVQAEQRADLIIWPETALPLYLQQTDQEFWRNIQPQGAALLTGIMDSPSLVQGNLSESYNAAVLSCEGKPQIYRKRHLVPFGEYLPLRFLFNWVLEYLDLPMSDFSAWKGVQPLDCGAIKVGLSICYEDAFANEYRQHLGDATLLVNISEDAWFGDSFAPHQRGQMAQMRASELGRPMVRSANSGPSLFINEKGKLLSATPQFEVHTLSQVVQPYTGDTPFKIAGNWVVWFCFMSIFVLAVLSRQNRGKRWA